MTRRAMPIEVAAREPTLAAPIFLSVREQCSNLVRDSWGIAARGLPTPGVATPDVVTRGLFTPGVATLVVARLGVVARGALGLARPRVGGPHVRLIGTRPPYGLQCGVLLEHLLDRRTQRRCISQARRYGREYQAFQFIH